MLDLAIRPGGNQVATAGADGTVRLGDAGSTGEARPLRTLGGAVGALHAVAYAPDGRNLAAGGKGGAILTWELENGRPIWAAPGRWEAVSDPPDITGRPSPSEILP